MFFGNLDKMQNTELNEENEEGRNIDEYEEFLEQKSKNESISTKIKDRPVIIVEECELLKIGEAGYCNSKNEGVRIIKTKEINKNKNIHLKSEKEKNKVELPNLNTNKNPFADNERKNEENLIFLQEKVKNNKLNEKKVNEKNINIIQKEKQKKKKKIKKANFRKKLMKKKFSKSKKEENNEIPSEIINALIWSYEHPENSANIHIPNQPFEKIKSPFYQNSQIDNDEMLTEDALININSNRPRYNIRQEDKIMDENDGENLFDLNENNHSDIDWVDLNLATNEVL